MRKIVLFFLFLFVMLLGVFATEVTIGDGNEEARKPVDMYWKNSLFQTLYFPDELGFTFTTPYSYTGTNLVMFVNRPMDADYFSSSDKFLCQTIGANRSLNSQSDSVTYDPAAPPAGPSISGQFPKTTFVYTGQAIDHDLSALTISGNTTPSAQDPATYTIRVKNNGGNTESSYTVKLLNEGAVEIASFKDCDHKKQSYGWMK